MFPHPYITLTAGAEKFAEIFGEFFFVRKQAKLAELFGYYC